MHEQPKKNAATARWTLGCILLSFFLPFVGATWLYGHVDRFTLPTKNRGVLFQPVLALDQLSLSAAAQDHLSDHWGIILINQGPCLDACQERLYWLHQMREAIPKDAHRVRLLVALPAVSSEFRSWLEQHDPQMAVSVVGSLPVAIPKQPTLVIVDPQAHVILHYPLEQNPNDLFKDLKWLLKNSQIG